MLIKKNESGTCTVDGLEVGYNIVRDGMKSAMTSYRDGDTTYTCSYTESGGMHYGISGSTDLSRATTTFELLAKVMFNDLIPIL